MAESQAEKPETDDDEQEPEYRKSRSSPALDTSKSLDDMTNAELRGKVASRAAHLPPEHALTKPIWNSVHAWLTGSFYVKPAMLKPGVPPKAELVEAAVHEAVAAYENHPTDPDDEDRPDHPVPALLDYRDHVAGLDDDEPPRAMVKAELRQLLNAMSTTGDQRQWSVQNQ